MLPYNYGFDDIIKQKSEEIDSQKEANSKVMDELVLKMGYMDYRDALACNKYILEAKRSGDYHQLARGRVLQNAMGRLARTRRENLEREAHKHATSQAQTGTEEYQRLNEDFKLNAVMNEDAEVAEQFQDALYEIRQHKEHDYNELQRIQKRFDFFKNPDNMTGKWKSKFDLPD